jgi:hypothetical protein
MPKSLDSALSENCFIPESAANEEQRPLLPQPDCEYSARQAIRKNKSKEKSTWPPFSKNCVNTGIPGGIDGTFTVLPHTHGGYPFSQQPIFAPRFGKPRGVIYFPRAGRWTGL